MAANKKTGWVWYLDLTNEQVNELNRGGWESKIGKLYAGPKYEKTIEAVAAAKEYGLYNKVAEVTAHDAEEVWVGLQNLNSSWIMSSPNTLVKAVFVERAKSMDIGDVIVWEDGTTEMVDSIGFKVLDMKWN